MKRTITSTITRASFSVLFLITMLQFAGTLSACPNCKGAFEKNEANSQMDLEQIAERERTGKAYNWSIMLMMPIPFLIAIGLGGMLYYHSKKASVMINPDLVREQTYPEKTDQDRSIMTEDSGK